MNTIARQLEQTYPETNKGWGAKIEPLQWVLTQDYRSALYLLFGAVTLMLLIACTNVASLLLARSSKRQKEIAIRTSFGAGRFRLVRQLLTESLLLALLGGFLGLLVAPWAIRLLVALLPEGIPKNVTMDERVLGCTFGISLMTGIVFGLIPAWRTSKPNLNETLKEGVRGSAGRSHHRTLGTLVVVETALALVLLICAGLMINSFLRLQRVHPGFNPEKLLVMEIYLVGLQYQEPAAKRKINMGRITPMVGSFYQRILERINTLPGVQAAAISDGIPMRGAGSRSFSIAGQPAPSPEHRLTAGYKGISPTYFQTMQMPLRKGRYLDGQDLYQAPWVAIINESMARKFWPNQNPLGQVITLDTVEEERPREIVGVVGDVRQDGLSFEPLPEIYVSHLQQPELCPGNLALTRLHKYLVLRTDSRSTGLISAVRKVVAEVDKDQPVYGIKSMELLVSQSIAPLRFLMRLLAIFASVALLLAVIGIYGVTSYWVNQRTQEIGIRTALGAQRSDVLHLILKRGALLSLIGILIGLMASFAATRMLSGFLFGVEAQDPITFAVVSLVLMSVTVLATYLPARRATKVDPMVALRYE